MKSIRPNGNSIFDICDNEGIKLLTRLRLGLSHLNKHKFNHGFLDTVNPMCSCNTEDETVTHYLLRCPNYTQQRMHLMNKITGLNPNLLVENHNVLSSILLYGSNQFNNQMNSKIINLTIEYIHTSERFNLPLL